MIFQKHINNSSALQTISLFKFFTFFIFSIVLVKNGYTKTQIGIFEATIIISGIVSFFWVYGIIHTLMTLYNNNESFPKISRKQKSPEIFNAFALLFCFNLLVLITLTCALNFIHIFDDNTDKYQLILIISSYIFFSNPSSLIEHIYVLRNKPAKIIYYGSIIYLITLALVLTPLLLKLDIKNALWGIVGASIIKFLWLVTLLKKYSVPKLSTGFIKEHLKISFPLIISYFLSGSAEYIDNLIVSLKMNFESLAIFRYGAKELPVTSGMVTGLHSSLMNGFTNEKEMLQTISALKEKSKKLMHFLFPISIIILLFANKIYAFIYSSDFGRSSDVFMVYLLLITSRLLFPNTILIGLKRNKIVLLMAFITLNLNIILSLLLIPNYGTVGVALATVIVYLIEKVALMTFVYKKYNITPSQYTAIFTYFTYSGLLLLTFLLIDWRIISF